MRKAILSAGLTAALIVAAAAPASALTADEQAYFTKQLDADKALINRLPSRWWLTRYLARSWMNTCNDLVNNEGLVYTCAL